MKTVLLLLISNIILESYGFDPRLNRHLLKSSIDHDEEENNLKSSSSIVPHTLKFLLATSTATQTVTGGTVTSTLTTFRSCFKTANNIPTCSSTLLTGKRKKRSSENPILVATLNDGTLVHLNPTRVQRDFKEAAASETTKESEKESSVSVNEVEVSGNVPDCLYESQNEALLRNNGGENESKSLLQRFLITVHSTITSTVTATTTSTTTNAATQSLSFATAAAGDCFPAGLVSALGLSAC